MICSLNQAGQLSGRKILLTQPSQRSCPLYFLGSTSSTSILSSKVVLGGSSPRPFAPYPRSGLSTRMERCRQAGREW